MANRNCSRNAPLVLIPQFFGCTVFDRGTSKYLPFDAETTALMRRSLALPFPLLMDEITDPEKREQTAGFYEHFYRQGFFGLDGCFAGVVLDLEPASDHMTGPLAVHLEIAAARLRLLDRLSVEEHGILFRYIPAGSFLMGSERGDPDETPIHEVTLSDYWLAETPLSLAKYHEITGAHERVGSITAAKLRIGYSIDWKAEPPAGLGSLATQEDPVARYRLPLSKPWEVPWLYDAKPMVAVEPAEIQAVCEHLSTPQILYRCPAEAEWEKAARGGIIGADYPWGNAPPTPEICDYGKLDRFHWRERDTQFDTLFCIHCMKAFPPNGYGLYTTSGGVWEWTADWYDALYYSESPPHNPTGPVAGEQKVWRGGSWTDCAEAVRVSFRMASRARECPNVGFRLCRIERSEVAAAAQGEEGK
ncbi:MAG: hypothetical protein JWL77_6362 [Chthonomonadaceae bacterium]|nr:hypothetical protein [Chthonomonadaceae bacterium]